MEPFEKLQTIDVFGCDCEYSLTIAHPASLQFDSLKGLAECGLTKSCCMAEKEERNDKLGRKEMLQPPVPSPTACTLGINKIDGGIKRYCWGVHGQANQLSSSALFASPQVNRVCRAPDPGVLCKLTPAADLVYPAIIQTNIT